MTNTENIKIFKIRNKNSIFYIYSILLIGILPLIIIPSDIDRFYEPKAIFLYFITILFLPFLYNNKTWREKSLIQNSLSIFMMLILLSTIFSIDIEISLFGKAFRKEGGITIIFYCIIFLIFYKEFNYSEKVMKIIFFFISIVALYGIVQYFGYDFISRDDIRKNWIKHTISTIGNRNFYASLIVIILPITLSIYCYTRKNIFLIYGCTLFCGLLLSMTRGCWIASAFSILLLLLYSINKTQMRRRMILILSLFLGIYLTLNYFTNGDISRRVSDINKDVNKLQTEDNDTAGSSRLYIWKRGITFIPERPILGSGPDTFGVLFMEKYTEEIDYMIKITGGIVDKAHNEYLQLAVTSGVPALIAYLVLVCFIVFKMFIHAKKEKNFIHIGIMCSIIGYLIQAFFNISVVGVAPIFWAILGIGANIATNNKKVRHT